MEQGWSRAGQQWEMSCLQLDPSFVPVCPLAVLASPAIVQEGAVELSLVPLPLSVHWPRSDKLQHSRTCLAGAASLALAKRLCGADRQGCRAGMIRALGTAQC